MKTEKWLLGDKNRHFHLFFENVTKIHAVTLKMIAHSQLIAQNARPKKF